MDTGIGRFAPISQKTASKLEKYSRPLPEIDKIGVFHVGETLIIRGSRFRIQSIGRNRMKLRLLPKD